MRQLTQEKLQDDYDPQSELKFDGFMIPQEMVDFGSQMNILPKETWNKMGRPNLIRSKKFLKVADQLFIEPISILKNVKIVIMGIPTLFDFKLINMFEGIHAYSLLVGWQWVRKMKSIISTEKGRIKFKGNGKKITIPLDPREGKCG
jgi:hypothetical protein